VPTKHCQLDPIPTWLLKQIAVLLASVLAVMCNTSLTTSKLPSVEKHATVSARLKKPTLDPTDLNSYRPISSLSFISKLIERSVAACFVAYTVNAITCFQLDSRLTDTISQQRQPCSLFTVISFKQWTEGSSWHSSFSTSALHFTPLTMTVYCPFCATGFQLTDQQHPDFSRTCQIVHRRSQRQSIMSPVELQCSVPQGSVLCPIQFIAYGGRSIPI